MRTMMRNLIVLLSAAFFVCSSAENVEPEVTQVLDIMKEHFDLSLDYLYTGVQFASQDGERPGLARKLRDMSDAHWEAGLATLNKYLQHGGSTKDDETFAEKLHFQGGQKASLTKKNKSEIYIDTLETLYENSANMITLYNDVYKGALIKQNGDIAHYLEEKIEKEVAHLHQLKGLINNLNAMKGIGAAVALFDKNL